MPEPYGEPWQKPEGGEDGRMEENGSDMQQKSV